MTVSDLEQVGSSSGTTVSPPWSSAGGAFTNPRPATDLLMSTYDTGQSDPADDIETAIIAANAIAANAGRARLIMDSRQRYSIARAARAGAHGELAQIRVPYLANSISAPDQQRWIELVGIPGGDVSFVTKGGAGKVGTVIESTLASASSPAYASTTGIASMIGGPASYSSINTATGKFTGVCLKMTDITLVQPANPPLAGLDFGWMFGTFLDRVNVTTPEFMNWAGSFAFTQANKQHAVGIQLPFVNCNPPVRVPSAAVCGYAMGFGLGECLDAGTLMAGWCVAALVVDSAYHPNRISRLFDINCIVGIGAMHPQAGASFLDYPVTTGWGSGKAATYASPVIIDDWAIQWNNGQSAGFDRVNDIYDNADVCPVAAIYSVVNAGSGAVTTAISNKGTTARQSVTKLYK